MMLPKRKLGTRARGLGHRPRVHGHELQLRPTRETSKEMIALMRTAVERGVTFFDTAEVYGPLTTKSSWARHSLRSASKW